jgi:hypothetical protein
MPRVGNYTPDETRALLKQYVLPTGCASDPFPTDLRTEWVSAFIRDTVQRDFIGLPMRRATDVVRFYALDDRTGQLAGLFTGSERTFADLQRACYLIVALCELGTADQQQAAVKQFERLVQAPVARDGFQALSETFFSLPPRVPATALAKRVSEARADCERRGPEDKLGDLMEWDERLLPWVLSAKTRKDMIVGLPPGPARLQRWAEAYLAYENTTPFTWDRQAGFALVQEGRAAGDAVTVKAITGAMAKIDAKKDDAELTKFRKTRGYHAREFFLEALTEEEKEDQAKETRPQEDLVA